MINPTPLDRAIREAVEAERERAVQIIEMSQGQPFEVDIFVFNGVEAKNKKGHTQFLSLENFVELMQRKVAAIRKDQP